MIAARMNSTRHRQCREHGLPTAAAVRSSQATPARRRGQAYASVPRTETTAFGAALPTPAMLTSMNNTVGFSLIVAG
jgi:hypothetical protein